ncbi:hypothetical protein D9756_001520 [Leucocoprinus leucothites]|uniref:Uncharacterized protein n=1 Tax=Leucocoprinus leucothites TaxID=201217 RepID=A0A8H5G4Y9_9AGAR|nr:hypothetical protein D9756_001520 [Leucoagaricus leucothites]
MTVDWQKGDALYPQSFAHIFPEVSGVVHTLGTLLEDADGAYKRAIRSGDVPGLLGSFLRNVVAGGGGGNPLEKHQQLGGQMKRGTYEVMNRDSALRACEAFVASTPTSAASNVPRPFVYISAEDIFRPVIPARYIETKREAERGIEEIMKSAPDFRGVYIRPSLVYHAHQRPLTTPAAVLFDLSTTLHAKVPRTLPTPSSVLRSLGSLFPQGVGKDEQIRGTGAESIAVSKGTIEDINSTTSKPTSRSLGDLGAFRAPSSFESMANALEIPPIHVDHVADAIMVALDSRSSVRGAVGVMRMRELIGWSKGGSTASGDVEAKAVDPRAGL